MLPIPNNMRSRSQITPCLHKETRVNLDLRESQAGHHAGQWCNISELETRLQALQRGLEAPCLYMLSLHVLGSPSFSTWPKMFYIQSLHLFPRKNCFASVEIHGYGGFMFGGQREGCLQDLCPPSSTHWFEHLEPNTTKNHLNPPKTKQKKIFCILVAFFVILWT